MIASRSQIEQIAAPWPRTASLAAASSPTFRSNWSADRTPLTPSEANRHPALSRTAGESVSKGHSCRKGRVGVVPRPDRLTAATRGGVLCDVMAEQQPKVDSAVVPSLTRWPHGGRGETG